MWVIVKDSTYTSERQKADTVYRERVVYRDRIEYRDRWRERIVQDTVVVSDSIVQVVEHPPQKYVPKFYKRCTIALWLIVLLVIGYGLWSWRIKRFRTGN